MNLPSEHELLSAYLDGELTAGERARVERLLAESPAARRVLDELRSVSVTVQNLPELRLSEDLTDRILRQAEQAILSGQDGPACVELASPPAKGRYRRLFLRLIASRGVAWSGVALAIALLIMLSGPREHQRDFAMAPEVASRKDGPAAPPQSVPKTKSPAIGEMWPADARREDLSRPEAADLEMAMPRDEPTLSEPTLDVAPKPAAAPISTSAATSKLDLDTTSTPKQPVVSEPPRVRFGVAPPAPMEAPASMEELEETPATEQRLRKGTEQRLRRTTARAPERMKQRDEKKTEAANPMIADSMQRKDVESAELPVLLVHCDVTPEAARGRTLDQVLVDQQVVARDNRRKNVDADRSLGADVAGRRASGRAGRELAETDDPGAGLHEPFDVVYVEATHDQVAATLDQMARLPDQFLAVSIKPAPGIPSQSNLTRFNRRIAPRSLAAPGGAVAAEPQPTPVLGGEAESARKSKEQVDKLESNQQAAPMPTAPIPTAPMSGPTFSRSARGQAGRQGPHMAGAGGAGYGAAADIEAEGRSESTAPHQSPSSELDQPDTLRDMATAKDAPSTDAPLEQYRVLFVLRVVPPTLLAAPATATSAAEAATESAPAGAAMEPEPPAAAPSEAKPTQE